MAAIPCIEYFNTFQPPISEGNYLLLTFVYMIHKSVRL